MEREHDAGRKAEPDHIGEVTEMVAPTVKPERLPPRPDKGLPFAAAQDETVRDHRSTLAALDDDPEYRRQMASAERVMRKHRNVLAALAESERQDCAAEVGYVNIRRGLTHRRDAAVLRPPEHLGIADP